GTSYCSPGAQYQGGQQHFVVAEEDVEPAVPVVQAGLVLVQGARGILYAGEVGNAGLGQLEECQHIQGNPGEHRNMIIIKWSAGSCRSNIGHTIHQVLYRRGFKIKTRHRRYGVCPGGGSMSSQLAGLGNGIMAYMYQHKKA